MKMYYFIISFFALFILAPSAFAGILYEEEARHPASATQNVEPVKQQETTPVVKQPVVQHSETSAVDKQPASTKPSACAKLKHKKQEVVKQPASTTPSACAKLKHKKQEVVRTPQGLVSDSFLSKIADRRPGSSCFTRSYHVDRWRVWDTELVCDGNFVDTFRAGNERDRSRVISELSLKLATNGLTLVNCNSFTTGQGDKAVQIHCYYQQQYNHPSQYGGVQ